MTDTVFLQHGHGTQGPFLTESVPHKLTKRPTSKKPRYDTRTRILVLYNGRWHRVHSDSPLTYIKTRTGMLHVTMTGFWYE